MCLAYILVAICIALTVSTHNVGTCSVIIEADFDSVQIMTLRI